MNQVHREYEPFELPENMEEDLGLFEAATRARHVELVLPELRRVLLAPDGSNQDATARAAARLLAGRLRAEVLEREGLASAAEICAAAAEIDAGLVVVPAPFGEDINLLKTRSLGSVVDTLLLELAVPVLCVRQPLGEEQLASLLRRVLVPVCEDNEDALRALAWGCRLAAPENGIVLLQLADQAAALEARQLRDRAEELPAMRRATLERVITARLGSLVAAAQRWGGELGFAVHVEFRAGAAVAEVAAWQARHGAALIVTGRSREPSSHEFHRAMDLVKASGGPVLLT